MGEMMNMVYAQKQAYYQYKRKNSSLVYPIKDRNAYPITKKGYSAEYKDYPVRRKQIYSVPRESALILENKRFAEALDKAIKNSYKTNTPIKINHRGDYNNYPISNILADMGRTPNRKIDYDGDGIIDGRVFDKRIRKGEDCDWKSSKKQGIISTIKSIFTKPKAPTMTWTGTSSTTTVPKMVGGASLEKGGLTVTTGTSGGGTSGGGGGGKTSSRGVTTPTMPISIKPTVQTITSAQQKVLQKQGMTSAQLRNILLARQSQSAQPIYASYQSTQPKSFTDYISKDLNKTGGFIEYENVGISQFDPSSRTNYMDYARSERERDSPKSYDYDVGDRNILETLKKTGVWGEAGQGKTIVYNTEGNVLAEKEYGWKPDPTNSKDFYGQEEIQLQDIEPDTGFDYYSRTYLPKGVREVPIFLKDIAVETAKGIPKIGMYAGETFGKWVGEKVYGETGYELESDKFQEYVGYNRDVPIYLDPDVQTAVLTTAFIGAGALASGTGALATAGRVGSKIGFGAIKGYHALQTIKDPSERNIAIMSLMVLPETTQMIKNVYVKTGSRYLAPESVFSKDVLAKGKTFPESRNVIEMLEKFKKTRTEKTIIPEKVYESVKLKDLPNYLKDRIINKIIKLKQRIKDAHSEVLKNEYESQLRLEQNKLNTLENIKSLPYRAKESLLEIPRGVKEDIIININKLKKSIRDTNNQVLKNEYESQLRLEQNKLNTLENIKSLPYRAKESLLEIPKGVKEDIVKIPEKEFRFETQESKLMREKAYKGIGEKEVVLEVSHATKHTPKRDTTIGGGKQLRAEDKGLYVTPKGEGSPYFTGIKQGELATEYTLNPFKELMNKPQVWDIKTKGVERLPNQILNEALKIQKEQGNKRAFEFINKWYETQAGKGKGYIPLRSELKQTHETQAIIPKGTKIIQKAEGNIINKVKGYEYYTILNGKAIPIRSFEIAKGKIGIKEFEKIKERIEKLDKANKEYYEKYAGKKYETIQPYVDYATKTYKNKAEYYKTGYEDSVYPTGKYQPYEKYKPEGYTPEKYGKYGEPYPYETYSPYKPTPYTPYPAKRIGVTYPRRYMIYPRDSERVTLAFRPIMTDAKSGKTIYGDNFASLNEAVAEGMIATSETPATEFTIQKVKVPLNQIKKGRDAFGISSRFMKIKDTFVERQLSRTGKSARPMSKSWSNFDLRPYVYGTN